MTVSLFVTAAPAAAQDSTGTTSPPAAESASVLARTHFERGVEHYSEGDYDAALAELQRSYELSPVYKLLFNLAQVQLERHDYAAALILFSDYLRSGGAAIPPERVDDVEQELLRLRQRTGELSIDVDVPGARIFVNAKLLGSSPLPEPVRVNVGSSRVRIEKAGYAPFEQSVSVAGAERQHVNAVLQPLLAALPAQPAAVVPSPSPSPSLRLETSYNTTPGWITVGAALALGGATATFGVLSVNAHQHQREVLARSPGRPSELDAARGRLQTFAVLTDVFAAASVATGVLGLYLLLSPPEQHEIVPVARASMRLTATPAGVKLDGVF